MMWLAVSIIFNVIFLVILIAVVSAADAKENVEKKYEERQSNVIEIPHQNVVNALWENRLRSLWDERDLFGPDDVRRINATVESFEGRVKRLERNSGLNV